MYIKRIDGRAYNEGGGQGREGGRGAFIDTKGGIHRAGGNTALCKDGGSLRWRGIQQQPRDEGDPQVGVGRGGMDQAEQFDTAATRGAHEGRCRHVGQGNEALEQAETAFGDAQSSGSAPSSPLSGLSRSWC